MLIDDSKEKLEGDLFSEIMEDMGFDYLNNFFSLNELVIFGMVIFDKENYKKDYFTDDERGFNMSKNGEEEKVTFYDETFYIHKTKI